MESRSQVGTSKPTMKSQLEELKTHEEIMDYFTRMVVDSSRDYPRGGSDNSSTASTADSELAITDQFGFVEKTLDASPSSGG